MEAKLHETVRQRQEYEQTSKAELERVRQEAEREGKRATAEAREKGQLTVSLSEARKSIVEKHKQWEEEKGKLAVKQTTLDSLNSQLQRKLETQSKEHTERIDAARKVAESGKSEAVKSSFERRE